MYQWPAWGSQLLKGLHTAASLSLRRHARALCADTIASSEGFFPLPHTYLSVQAGDQAGPTVSGKPAFVFQFHTRQELAHVTMEYNLTIQ